MHLIWQVGDVVMLFNKKCEAYAKAEGSFVTDVLPDQVKTHNSG